MATTFETPYSRAWDAFTRTQEFKTCSDPKALGISEDQRRYIQNRLRRAFDAGWNAKTSLILDTLNQMADKPKGDL